MLVVITYDVKTSGVGGNKRLRQVAKKCESYGLRVQNSVFECNIDAAQLVKLRYDLIKIINASEDSLRFYRLGNNYKSKVEHIGTKDTFDLDEPLIF
ncbi:CRISPR-associated endonuclease Cas2 [Kurthia sibirica]|uniref:CRISPR-associated endoribonuclease Cas2 n=1 Tax=Kurthia sibirica TaxID=202750 RepID=A0A2U3APE9_9BACL|nr:CRISPR-associated endonuclease Cas2 [Kurthia sibirica]PWI26428.1 CRISPR-associated endonuclease Cas2 [Kurthia sibirica]GEK32992.1 CRISPR-associated endoribonuclease Cas2 [Kurthia sibirica]